MIVFRSPAASVAGFFIHFLALCLFKRISKEKVLGEV